MEDEDLIRQAQAGDENAMDTILGNYKNLVTSIARKYFIVGGETEDLVQWGMIGLFKAIINYRFDRNAVFKTYASKVIKNHIGTEIRHSKTGNVEISNDMELYNSFDSCSESASPESDIIEEESYNELLKEILNSLSKNEKKVLEYYLDGHSRIGIANMVGEEPKKVDNALARAKKKIKQKLKELKEGK